MNGEDRELGMGRAITRRDFIQGVAAASAVGAAAVTAGAALAKSSANSAAGYVRPATPENYPPLREGMRGMHPGSFEAAHAMRDGEKFGDGADTGETYDLVVVGGGLSGLAAAWYYRERAGRDARILILDNHDDFGGHAKRNEFEVAGQQMMVTGGSAYMVAPKTWPNEAMRLVKSLGVHRGDPSDRVDGSIYSSRGMGEATFFRKEVYGNDKLVVGGSFYRPNPEFMAAAPIPEALKPQLLRLMTGRIDYLPGLSVQDKMAKLKTMSYRDYLLDVAKFPPEALQYTMGVWCLGNDMCTAYFAHFRGAPGFLGLGIPMPSTSPESDQNEAEDFHMPAGNSDIARLIVRDLIPDALPPGSFSAIETARTDYSTLDRPGQNARIRLNSIVVRAKHVNTSNQVLFDPDKSEVQVSYITGDKLFHVRAKDVVMACMNNVIPYLCPEMPDAQKVALHQAVRAANQTTTVAFRNWKAFEQLKIRSITMPRAFFGRIGLASPRYFGALKPSTDPSQPILAGFNTGLNSGICSNETMVETLLGASLPVGMSMDDQFRAVRAGLLATPFDTFEREVRRAASGILAGTDFDPGRDIVGITVNRWPHGFATGRNMLFDETGPGTVSPTLIARKKFGRIAIANSDASGQGLADTAIDEAFRAVRDLERRDFGYYETF